MVHLNIILYIQSFERDRQVCYIQSHRVQSMHVILFMSECEFVCVCVYVRVMCVHC